MAQLTPIEIFLNIDPKKLGRRDDLGQKSFDDLVPHLEWMHSTLKQGVNLIRQIPNLEKGYSDQVNHYVAIFNRIAQQIESYNLYSDNQGVKNNPIRDNVIRLVNEFYTSFFNGSEIDSRGQNSSRNNFFVLLNALNTIDDRPRKLDAKLAEVLKKSEEELKSITQIRKEAEAASRELTEKAFRPATLALYADYFNNEAKLHSRMGLPKVTNPKNQGKEMRTRMGGAEKWLVAGLCTSVTTLILLIIDLGEFSKTDSFSPVTVVNGLIVAILFFLSRFFFKQFSIHKHLFTLNRHRANSLSSFFSMSETGGLDDASKNEISKIVARAIYESSHTGYIPGDAGELNLPVSIELIKGLTSK